MNATHMVQSPDGKWHRVTKSTGKPGAYCEWHKGVPSRLWLPGQFNAKNVKVI